MPTLDPRAPLLALATLPLLAACTHRAAPEPWPAPEARIELIVLGTAQDGALPHVGCSKACCQEARRTGRVLYPACVAIHDRERGGLALVEATPHVEAQLALLHRLSGQEARGRQPVDAVLLTHAHMGHYLGLAHFGFEVASTDRLPLFVSERLGAYLRDHGPWSQLVEMEQVELRATRPGVAFDPLTTEGELSVTPIRVPHRDEFSDTVGFRIAGPNRTALFLPDIDAWDRVPGGLLGLLEGVDLAFLDASFYDGRELPGRDLSAIPHPMMVDTMERLEAADWEGELWFLHLNHTNPVLHDDALRAALEARGFGMARRGMRFAL